jgi:tetratricopeptide (TPR) repeat protein
VGKALEKDPEGRYASASALGDDVGRYLASQPILARPPSTVYQLRKAFARNRVPSILAGILALSIVGFGAAMGVLYTRAEREGREAKRQARIAQAVNEFLNEDLLAGADPGRNTDHEITMRSVVDIAAAKIGGRFAAEPLVEAAIRRTLGQTYMGLGVYDQAATHLEGARALYAKEGGDDEADTLRTASLLGTAEHHLGKYEEAEKRLVATAERQKRVVGESNRDTLETLGTLAGTYFETGRLDLAEQTLAPAIEAAKRGLGEDAETTMSLMNTSAMVATDQGRLKEAEAIYLRLLEHLRKKMGADSPSVLETENNLGQVYVEGGRVEEAERITRDTLARSRRVLGSEHKTTLDVINNLAVIDVRLGRMEEAETLYREGYDTSRRLFGGEAQTTLISMTNLTSFYFRSNRCQEQQGFMERAVELARKHPSPDTPPVGLTLRALGTCRLRRGPLREAEAALLESESQLSRIYGADSPRLVDIRRSLAEAYDKLGRPEAAAEWRKKAERAAPVKP